MAAAKKVEPPYVLQSRHETGSPILTMPALREMVAWYQDQPEWAFDLETVGTRAKRYPKDKPAVDVLTNEVIWLSFAGPGRCDTIPVGHPTGPEQLWRSEVFPVLEPLFFNDARKVGHNLRFDIETMAKYYDGEPPIGPYACTMVAQHVLNENLHVYNLGAITQRHFGFLYDKGVGKKGPETFPFREVARYAYLDAKYTWLLWCKLKKILNAQRLAGLYRLEMDVMRTVVHMELTGAPVDREQVERLDVEMTQRLNTLQDRIFEANGAEFNLDAPIAKGKFVYGVLGHKPVLFTDKTKKPSTAAGAFEPLAKKDPLVADMLAWTGTSKLKGTFVTGLRNHIHTDGRVYTRFNQVGTVTGRWSSNEINLQNIPVRTDEGKQVRNLFPAPPGYVYVVSDFSQIELRVLAHFTQDPLLVGAYTQGLDLHMMTAKTAYHTENPTPEERGLAKNVNFSVTFGVTPGTLVLKYGVKNEKEGQMLIDAFYATYVKVMPWQTKTLQDARSRRPPHTQTLLGRKRRLPALLATQQGARRAAERQAINAIIQGSAADIMKIAMVRFLDAIEVHDPRMRLVFTVHDEMGALVPEELADEGAKMMTEAMEGAYELNGVPLVANTSVVDNWGAAKS